MNKNELVASIAERTGVKKAQVKTVLDMVGVIAAEQVSVAGGFKLPGIGGFESYDKISKAGQKSAHRRTNSGTRKTFGKISYGFSHQR